MHSFRLNSACQWDQYQRCYFCEQVSFSVLSHFFNCNSKNEKLYYIVYIYIIRHVINAPVWLDIKIV